MSWTKLSGHVELFEDTSFFSLLSDALQQDSVGIILDHHDCRCKLIDKRKQGKTSVKESKKTMF